MTESNPLIGYTGIPAFDKITPEHVVPAVEYMLKKVETKFDEIVNNIVPTWDGLILKLEEMERPFEQVWGPIGHFMGVKNSNELREAYESVQGKVVELSLKIGQSREVYDGLVALRDSEAFAGFSDAQKRAIELRIKGAERSGISLEGEKRDKFNEIATKLSKLSTDFSNNVLDSTKAFELIVTNAADMEGCPDSLKNLAAQSYNSEKKTEEATAENGPWRITLDYPSYGPFMQHCPNSELRKTVMMASVSRASKGEHDNTEIVRELLQLRQQKAQLLGFENYAAFSLDAKMAQTVDAVDQMRAELYDVSYEKAKEERATLQKFANENGFEGELAHWDTSFWAERQREKLFDYTDDQLRPYFPMPKVINGLFELSKKLFGIDIVEANGEAPVWNEDVRYYKVFNETGENIASFYLDPYTRPADKRGGAWMDTFRDRQWVDGKLELPVVYLTCNQAPPINDKPSMMSLGEVNTLFHEFGHGLQAMLTTIDVADVAGICGVEWDAVELASQFMENWCYDKETLVGMTEHVETGEQLPDELFDKIYAAKNYLSAGGMLRQIMLGWVDMELYSNYDAFGEKSPLEVQMEIAEKCTVSTVLKEQRLIHSFGHIMSGGYAAGYYSYKWAEVLSADAFGAFEDAGIHDDEAVKATGRRFRDTVLSMGGSLPPMDVFVKFRGRKPNTDALLRHSGLK